MGFNAKWDRWILASLTKSFHDASLGAATKIYPNEEVNTASLAAWITLRLGKPDWTRRQKGHYHAEIDIDVLVSTRRTTNQFNSADFTGAITAWLDGPIQLWSYGEPSPEVLGCFDLGIITENEFPMLDGIEQSSVQTLATIDLTE